MFVIVGCSATSTPTPTGPSAAVATPSAAVAATPSATAGASSAVVIDPALLAYLPASVDGLPMLESPEAEAGALADPELASVGSAIAAGIALDGSSGEFVYALVVRLLAGSANEAPFAHWRDRYDEGVCAQAGGVADTAEAQLGGRTVYTATCVEGVRTYHAWLDAQGIFISASDVGDRRLGDQLMKDLADH
jgi:hypothetical protein